MGSMLTMQRSQVKYLRGKNTAGDGSGVETRARSQEGLTPVSNHTWFFFSELYRSRGRYNIQP